MSQEHGNVKAFVTSRPENDIERMFRRLQTPTICIRAKNTADDIRKYVVDNVASLIESEKLQLQDPELASVVIETLVSKADGM
jgi:hypothetical protein